MSQSVEEEVKVAEPTYDMLKKRTPVSSPRNHMLRSKFDKFDFLV